MTSFKFQGQTPSRAGYAMPPEWATQRAMWFSWAHNTDTWPDNLERVQKPYAQMVAAFSRVQPVEINVPDTKWRDHARQSLEQADARMDNVRFHLIPTNDSWIRDHGPIFLKKKIQGPSHHDPGNDEPSDKIIANFGFNSWGEKYPPFDKDNSVPQRISDALEIERFDAPFILEGGSIDINGAGVLLTTENCLLNPNRNPDLSKTDLENCLKEWIGVQKIFWLGDGIIGDDTDGHIDDITRFINETTIVTALEKKSSDPNYKPLMENRERLEDLTLVDGSKPDIIELPMPEPAVYKGDRLPSSYANFTFANGIVVVPTFDCGIDKQALGILSEMIPDRKIIGIDARWLVLGLGAVHCLTQQEPE